MSDQQAKRVELILQQLDQLAHVCPRSRCASWKSTGGQRFRWRMSRG
jgi:hypothetical protein